MSHSVLFYFSNLIKKASPKTITILSGGIVISHLIYTLGTTQNETITIKHKYKFDVNGYTNFMVIDDKNKHYGIGNGIQLKIGVLLKQIN